MKLAARFPMQSATVKTLISQHATSIQLEVQSRSCEYTRLFSYDTIRPQVGGWRGWQASTCCCSASHAAALGFAGTEPAAGWRASQR